MRHRAKLFTETVVQCDSVDDSFRLRPGYWGLMMICELICGLMIWVMMMLQLLPDGMQLPEQHFSVFAVQPTESETVEPVHLRHIVPLL
jgi:hypothetical protein